MRSTRLLVEIQNILLFNLCCIILRLMFYADIIMWHKFGQFIWTIYLVYMALLVLQDLITLPQTLLMNLSGGWTLVDKFASKVLWHTFILTLILMYVWVASHVGSTGGPLFLFLFLWLSGETLVSPPRISIRISRVCTKDRQTGRLARSCQIARPWPALF